MAKGKVYLIGAGPGDVELLTTKAERLIKNAEVVVYDRLVSQSIMELVPKTAKLINVGKNAGNHAVPQPRISEILVEEAEKYHNVVRLKGGDSFVFGRGGEEIEVLIKGGVEFEVVPGITSSISVPAYAGIPVTHRDFCSSLHIVTGHAKAGATLNIDFESLVKLNGTLIFMMSVSTIGEIAKGLINANMPSDMPCAVIENGTYSNQRKFISTLADIENTVKENAVKSPSVIVVGKVCTLSNDFDWFSKKPLRNTKVLVTQPTRNASKLASAIRDLGGNAVTYPCIETEYIRPINVDLNDYTAIAFSSAVGVNSMMEWLDECGLDCRALYGKKIMAVGTQTAKALKEHGIKADFVPTVADGKHLAEEMISNNIINSNDKLLLPRPKVGSMEIIDILDSNNMNYTELAVYETKKIPHDTITDIASYDYIAFSSKSTVEGFIASQNTTDFSNVKAVCIGTQTADEAKKYSFDVIVSKVATIDSMVEAIIDNK